MTARRGDMAALRTDDPDLWRELEETYTALELTKSHGAYPPSSQALLALADRLEGVAGS